MRFSRYISDNLYESHDCFRLSSGDGEIRTLDPLLARQVLSQLSYTPIWLFYQYLIFKTFVLNGLEWTRTTDLTLIRRAL